MIIQLRIHSLVKLVIILILALGSNSMIYAQDLSDPELHDVTVPIETQTAEDRFLESLTLGCLKQELLKVEADPGILAKTVATLYQAEFPEYPEQNYFTLDLQDRKLALPKLLGQLDLKIRNDVERIERNICWPRLEEFVPDECNQGTDGNRRLGGDPEQCRPQKPSVVDTEKIRKELARDSEERRKLEKFIEENEEQWWEYYCAYWGCTLSHWPFRIFWDDFREEYPNLLSAWEGSSRAKSNAYTYMLTWKTSDRSKEILRDMFRKYFKDVNRTDFERRLSSKSEHFTKTERARLEAIFTVAADYDKRRSANLNRILWKTADWVLTIGPFLLELKAAMKAVQPVRAAFVRTNPEVPMPRSIAVANGLKTFSQTTRRESGPFQAIYKGTTRFFRGKTQVTLDAISMSKDVAFSKGYIAPQEAMKMMESAVAKIVENPRMSQYVTLDEAWDFLRRTKFINNKMWKEQKLEGLASFMPSTLKASSELPASGGMTRVHDWTIRKLLYYQKSPLDQEKAKRITSVLLHEYIHATDGLFRFKNGVMPRGRYETGPLYEGGTEWIAQKLMNIPIGTGVGYPEEVKLADELYSALLRKFGNPEQAKDEMIQYVVGSGGSDYLRLHGNGASSEYLDDLLRPGLSLRDMPRFNGQNIDETFLLMMMKNDPPYDEVKEILRRMFR